MEIRPPYSVSYSGHVDYVHNLMTTFVRAFNVPAVSVKLHIRVKLGLISHKPMRVNVLSTIRHMIVRAGVIFIYIPEFHDCPCYNIIIPWLPTLLFSLYSRLQNGGGGSISLFHNGW